MNRILPVRSVNEDDIEHLRHDLGMPGFNYVDFSAMREREQALARWPLLRELELAAGPPPADDPRAADAEQAA